MVAERQAEKDRQQALLKSEQDRMLAEKAAQSQKRLQEFEAKRLREQEERRELAARKAAEIQAGIDRMNALEAERLNTIMSKEQEVLIAFFACFQTSKRQHPQSIAQVQHRLALAAEQKKVEELQKQQALEASNAARAEALRCAKEAERKRKEELILKQRADEQRMQEMKQARSREHAIKQEILRLSKQDKLDAVERLRRQDEV
jgi:acyl-CoA synthetase (AMP-forming)/AMP-acid ligase II